MMRWLSQLSIPQGLLLFVLAPGAISALLARFVRRWKTTTLLSANNEFAAIMYPVIGLFYGVFLAFAIVIVWQRFTDAEQSAATEVAALGELWRDAQVFPPEDRGRMQERAEAYTAAVKDIEWARMAARNADGINDTAYDALWGAYYVYEPRTETEKAFYAKSLDELNVVGTSRRQRLLFSSSEMPSLLWGFLLFGAVVTTVSSYFLGTKHLWMHSLTCAALSALVGFSLLLVVSLQYPFAGPVSVKNTPYANLLRVFDAAPR